MNKTNLRIKNIYGNGMAAEKIVKYLEKINVDQRLLKKEISY